MTATFEVPFRPKLFPDPGRLDPPLVPVEPRWEYREITRDHDTEGLPTESELNQLGSEQWELTGVISEGGRVHFYFKRPRYP
jgi:hypothetical protein